MVAVKKSCELRVCINPKPLDSALKREHCLANNRVFSKVDFAALFWHLELDHESTVVCSQPSPHPMDIIVGFICHLVSACRVKYFRGIFIKSLMVFLLSTVLPS